MTVTRVTVIDDDRDVLDLFRDIFADQPNGWQVETFGDALPGIQQVIRSRPDLIIADLKLDPEREQLTGLQLIHAARSSVQLRNVPIVVCSADMPGLQTAWPELMLRGDIHQLEKPFDLPTLGRVLNTALGRAQPGFPEAGGTLYADRSLERHSRDEEEEG